MLDSIRFEMAFNKFQRLQRKLFLYIKNRKQYEIMLTDSFSNLMHFKMLF